jgi:hypothetical protein
LVKQQKYWYIINKIKVKKMKNVTTGPSMPTAHICINKSKLKIYNKETTPTFYLEKGQEFQIEIFNPTSDTILSKISLNGKLISQGGLVIRPGERVFLERYIDVANKFKFDTYEVSNSTEVKEAIKDNGDFTVQFFKERQPQPYYHQNLLINRSTLGGSFGTYNGSGSFTTTNTIGGGISTYTSSNSTLTSVDLSDGLAQSNPNRFTARSRSGVGTDRLKKSMSVPLKTMKTIETGRVEAGSSSNQELKTVNKEFEYFPFHSVEYKLLPISQKINTSDDINVKRYCSNCGKKTVKADKFCSQCGNKL